MEIRSFLWKVQRKVFGHHLGRMFFYQPRLDQHQNVVPLRRFGDVNRWFMEKGCTPPWIMSRTECQEHWRRITNQDELSGNRPDDYASKPQEIIRFLHEFWAPYIGQEHRILELGCNCGVNLNGLLSCGYTKLYGIEINKNAVTTMKSRFPDLAMIATISVGSLEELLPKAPTASVDALFTMAVLIHIHPKSNYLFGEMVRVAQKYICVIEVEGANCAYVFARNYRRVFEGLGCSHVKSVLITKEVFPETLMNYYGYVARLFEVPR